MAVTNLKTLSASIYNQGQAQLPSPKKLQGNGTPVGDTALASDGKYPIGSEYLDVDSFSKYFKATAGIWTQSESSLSIVGTTADTTTDFGAVLVGDLIVHIPVAAGNARFGISVTDGTSPFAAAVGDLYIIIRK